MTGNWMIDGDQGNRWQSPCYVRSSEFEKQVRQQEQLKSAFDTDPYRLSGETHDWRILLDSIENPKACLEEITLDCETSMHIVDGQIAIDFTFYE